MRHIRLRTEATRDKVDSWIRDNKESVSCPMCDKTTIKEYEHWKIQENDFPYDHLAKRHHLLTLKRHVGELRDLNEAETIEYREIAHSLHGEYSSVVMNLGTVRSVPKHLHFHLLEYIDDHI